MWYIILFAVVATSSYIEETRWRLEMRLKEYRCHKFWGPHKIGTPDPNLPVT